MAKYSMEDCKENNLFEEAKERYETTSPRWKKSWWQVICDIWTRAGDWHEKYELDKIAKVIINKIKDAVNQAKQVVTRTGINIIERVATAFEAGTKLCYLFKFYDSNGDLIFSKVGTTERTIRQRLTEEIKYYRKRGIDVNYATVESVFDTGDLEPEGAQDFAKGYYTKKYKGHYMRNDRFTCDINVEGFNKLIADYLAA